MMTHCDFSFGSKDSWVAMHTGTYAHKCSFRLSSNDESFESSWVGHGQTSHF
jgi:hypothetical protein